MLSLVRAACSLQIMFIRRKLKEGEAHIRRLQSEGRFHAKQYTAQTVDGFQVRRVRPSMCGAIERGCSLHLFCCCRLMRRCA